MSRRRRRTSTVTSFRVSSALARADSFTSSKASRSSWSLIRALFTSRMARKQTAMSAMAAYPARHQTHQSAVRPHANAIPTTRTVVTACVEIGRRPIRPDYRARANVTWLDVAGPSAARLGTARSDRGLGMHEDSPVSRCAPLGVGRGAGGRLGLARQGVRPRALGIMGRLMRSPNQQQLWLGATARRRHSRIEQERQLWHMYLGRKDARPATSGCATEARPRIRPSCGSSSWPPTGAARSGLAGASAPSSTLCDLDEAQWGVGRSRRAATARTAPPIATLSRIGGSPLALIRAHY